MSNKKLIIIGTGGHSRVVVETAQLLKHDIIGLIDVNYKGRDEEILGVSVLGDLKALDNYSMGEIILFVAVGDNLERQEISKKIKATGFSIISLIHPTAICSPSAKVGEGTLINAGCIINAEAEIGEGTIVNTGVIIDHETKTGRFSHIAPGCKIAGRVSIGDLSFIGIGTTIIDKITIGHEVIVGAGSIIIRDITDKEKVVGISKELPK